MKRSIYYSEHLENSILPDYLKAFHSDKVKKNCASFIAAICDYCRRDFLNIDALHAQSYFNYLSFSNHDGKKLALSTIQLKYSTLHAFSNYLIRNSGSLKIEYSANPFDKINFQKPDPYLNASKVPTPEQINSILQRCESEPVLYSAISLIIKCGFTVGELLKLRQDSFILDDCNHAAVVFSYRDTQRYVKIPEDVLSVLDYYWKNQTNNTEYLFENKSGRPMRVRDIERLYKKCMGTYFQFTLSDLRSACIALLCASGVSAKELGKYVGIQNYSWLRRYDKIIPELSLAPCDYSNLIIKPPSAQK
ncbi:MAG: phage integrase family protein [Eubacterium sp.]|nr:phage integrase family protein [Eubacterium sp.]